jgi:hypothetical protein
MPSKASGGGKKVVAPSKASGGGKKAVAPSKASGGGKKKSAVPSKEAAVLKEAALSTGFSTLAQTEKVASSSSKAPSSWGAKGSSGGKKASASSSSKARSSKPPKSKAVLLKRILPLSAVSVERLPQARKGRGTKRRLDYFPYAKDRSDTSGSGDDFQETFELQQRLRDEDERAEAMEGGKQKQLPPETKKARKVGVSGSQYQKSTQRHPPLPIQNTTREVLRAGEEPSEGEDESGASTSTRESRGRTSKLPSKSLFMKVNNRAAPHFPGYYYYREDTKQEATMAAMHAGNASEIEFRREMLKQAVYGPISLHMLEQQASNMRKLTSTVNTCMKELTASNCVQQQIVEALNVFMGEKPECRHILSQFIQVERQYDMKTTEAKAFFNTIQLRTSTLDRAKSPCSVSCKLSNLTIFALSLSLSLSLARSRFAFSA